MVLKTAFSRDLKAPEICSEIITTQYRTRFQHLRRSFNGTARDKFD
jgi:hypothetical protein